MIDLYCERTDSSFWSEPLNALTNFAFIIASAIALNLWRQCKAQISQSDSIVLAAMAINIGLIGLGSFLFHTLATQWAMFADVIPIYIYKVALLLLYPCIVLNYSWRASLGLFVLFIASTYAVKFLPLDLNGSQMYLPAITMLVLFALLHKHKSQKYDVPLLLANLFFVISITLRSIDNLICQYWPVGSHFGWHLCNGFVLFYTWKSIYQAIMAKRAADI
ncbi:hypothetical protein DS2_00690 [Catenovulum agarivorans DS-2]|uniref:Ceramidase n=1 Tax=Catenovulum agarivorans DS-2 TaxID=1328313 RepID=W7R3J4_9ALTE|nr:ceramidase domain-containing protein [Catenovulum agarivorans]EWH12195.1 hypothetical protein DS2_00690 [Catenovulum agarivorans DS-2]